MCRHTTYSYTHTHRRPTQDTHAIQYSVRHARNLKHKLVVYKYIYIHRTTAYQYTQFESQNNIGSIILFITLLVGKCKTISRRFLWMKQPLWMEWYYYTAARQSILFMPRIHTHIHHINLFHPHHTYILFYIFRSRRHRHRRRRSREYVCVWACVCLFMCRNNWFLYVCSCGYSCRSTTLYNRTEWN